MNFYLDKSKKSVILHSDGSTINDTGINRINSFIGVIFFFADGFFKPSFFLPIFYQNIKQLKYINNVYIIKKP